MKLWSYFVCIFLLASTCTSSSAWGSEKDKVKLKDVETLTLHEGKLSSGRRSAGVPQLTCVGGSAGCSPAFTPKVVQCYNRGSDGYDVQWECKADMNNAYRFGKIEVVCEGYDYPDDPYILKGSCALEYTLEWAESSRHTGQSHQEHQHHDYYNTKYTKSTSSTGNLLVFGAVGLVAYAIYKTCIARPHTTEEARSRTNDDFSNPRPPPPGFRSDFTNQRSDDSCGAGSSSTSGAAGTGAGGFWTGAATGGLLGYMLGGRNQNQGGYFGGGATNYGFTQPRPSTSSWGGSSSGPSTSGTSTSSGFGGTRRR